MKLPEGIQEQPLLEEQFEHEINLLRARIRKLVIMTCKNGREFKHYLSRIIN